MTPRPVLVNLELSPVKEGTVADHVRRGLGGAVLIALTAAGCAPVSKVIDPMIDVGPGLEAPASWLRPVDECLRRSGIVAVEVVPPRAGTNAKYGYAWQTNASFTWQPRQDQMDDAMSCHFNASSNDGEMPEEELRALFDRWGKERLCLLDFGVDVPEPPAFDDSRDAWNTGVGHQWSPIGAMRPTQEMLDTCGLEMAVDDGGTPIKASNADP